jgi:anionic cell wall polymer biosynthesis LytR-Cps2A-Psr (LCP) family protein
VTVTPDGSRVGQRAELRAKRRKQRRRLVGAGATAFVVLVALLAVLLVKTGATDGKKRSGHTRTQKTVLLQISSPDGSTTSSALLADDRASNNGSVVLVQPEVLANVPGLGSLTFGRALATGGAAGARNALSDLIGVTIDGSWVLNASTFTRLVDQLGGLSVAVDTTVLQGRTVALQPGPQHLTGAQALLFAGYLGAGEQEAVRLTRLQAVLDALLSALPKDATSQIGSLGGGSTSSLPTATLAGVLSGLASDDKASNLQYASLPVTKVDIDETERLRLDVAGTKSLVTNLLAPSIPAGVLDTGNRVLVLNGVGPSIGDKARAKLVPAGFVYVGQRNAPHFGYATTQVLVPSASLASAALGARVAKALGVPTTSVLFSDSFGTIADVVVIIGADFSGK